MAERLALMKDIRYVSRHPLVRNALLVVMALAMVVLAAAIVVWLPERLQYSELLVEVERVNTERERRRRVDNVLVTAERTRELLSAANRRFATTIEQADQVAQFHEIAGRHGVVILSESNRQGEPREGYVPLLQEAVLTGDYVAIRRVIDDIYALPSVTLPWDITLTAIDDESGKVRASLLLATYRRSGAGGFE